MCLPLSYKVWLKSVVSLCELSLSATIIMTHGRRTLTDLPNELLFEIFTDVSCSTQVSLCTVSSTIHAIATLVLYRTVVAQDSARLVKVCKTLATNAIAGQAVRHLFVLVNERTLARVRLGAGRSL